MKQKTLYIDIAAPEVDDDDGMTAYFETCDQIDKALAAIPGVQWVDWEGPLEDIDEEDEAE